VGLGVEGQSLTAKDQVFILMQAGLYLIHTRGTSSSEAHICCARAESAFEKVRARAFSRYAIEMECRRSYDSDLTDAEWSRWFPLPNMAGVPPNTLGVRS
jgi:hypothetical protein